jgi:hypothetical protein
MDKRLTLFRLMQNSLCKCPVAILTYALLSCSEPVIIAPIGQENAIWSESKYLRGHKPSTKEPLTEKHLLDYAQTLKNNNIKYAYLFAGPYQKDGHLPEYPFSELAINNVKKLKRYYPEIVILPWVGGIQNKTVFLDDSLWVKNALSDSQKLMRTLNVSGLHVDLEFIMKGDPYLERIVSDRKAGDREVYAANVNKFHKKLRLLNPDAFISSVVVSTAPDTKPWKRKTTLNELKELVKHVDQLSFLYYDTFISDQNVFEQNCHHQIMDIQTLRNSSQGREIQYLMAIGTFVNERPLRKYRDLNIENIPNSICTIKRSSLKVSKESQLVDGLAIYCEWETHETEWEDISKYW